ncbi:hypothetical protein BURMUCGD1_0309 [Burkholderia multivorans CGD1]|nr:hypothetical protein BURMUCGD1_0309 [Burkholderia multivorans CGD1]
MTPCASIALERDRCTGCGAHTGRCANASAGEPAVHTTRCPNVAYISLIDSIASQCAATSALNKTAH